MVNSARGRLFRRKDGKYLIYVPLDLAEDSMFPFKNYKRTKRGADAVKIRVAFKQGDNKLTIEEWKDTDKE
jgi:hypothetical protein